MSPSTRRAARTPRYSRFLITGTILGAVVGVLAAFAHGGARLGQQVAYAGCFLALLGALAAGVVAIALDRPQRDEQTAADAGEGVPMPREQPTRSAP